jgi:hypothetical protein
MPIAVSLQSCSGTIAHRFIGAHDPSHVPTLASTLCAKVRGKSRLFMFEVVGSESSNPRSTLVLQDPVSTTISLGVNALKAARTLLPDQHSSPSPRAIIISVNARFVEQTCRARHPSELL